MSGKNDRLFENNEFYSKRTLRAELQYAVAKIKQNYADNLTLEQMTKDVDMSPVHFARLFKKETGMTFLDFLTNYRSHVAEDLLTSGTYRVN